MRSEGTLTHWHFSIFFLDAHQRQSCCAAENKTDSRPPLKLFSEPPLHLFLLKFQEEPDFEFQSMPPLQEFNFIQLQSSQNCSFQSQTLQEKINNQIIPSFNNCGKTFRLPDILPMDKTGAKWLIIKQLQRNPNSTNQLQILQADDCVACKVILNTFHILISNFLRYL